MDYNEYGYGYDSLGNPIDKNHKPALGKTDMKGWGSLLLLLGIGIALFNNGTRWKLAIIHYFSNLLHHPAQLLHLDTLFFLMFVFFMAMAFFKLLKRHFFN